MQTTSGHTAIILAGGLGTRLRSAVPDLPKCMAPVAGKPFVAYVLETLHKQGITKFILSLGYKYEPVVAFVKQQYPNLSFIFSVEEEPLGTGGGIKKACEKTTSENVLVANGDTLFDINIQTVFAFHHAKKSICTLALKPMRNFERYGVVELKADNKIASFKEKQFYESGLINGGVYALNVPNFLSKNLPEKFSFEKDFLEKFYTEENMYGFIQDQYFIDIGIPEDYEKANKDFIELFN
jgi:D-glycero-alpha-D-manno-heptose 1-phosphate guanylyltransferase